MVLQYGDDFGNVAMLAFGSMSLGALFVWISSLVYNADLFSRPKPKASGEIPPLDIKDKYYDTPHRVCGGAKVKHRVILVRHGESQHNKRHDGRDGTEMSSRPSLDTELTEDGLIQAEDVGNFLFSFEWHPDVIRASPMLRTRQTAEPFLQKWFCKHTLSTLDGRATQDGVIIKTMTGDNTLFVPDRKCMEVNTWEDQDMALDGHVTRKETYAEFVERVVEWKRMLERDSESRPGERLQTLVFTHSMVISEFLNSLVTEDRRCLDVDEWPSVYWQVNHGSITCADLLDNGEWHIQAVNYTKHITRFTCAKSPFV